jgi:hypothetical protein
MASVWLPVAAVTCGVGIVAYLYLQTQIDELVRTHTRGSAESFVEPDDVPPTDAHVFNRYRVIPSSAYCKRMNRACHDSGSCCLGPINTVKRTWRGANCIAVDAGEPSELSTSDSL